LSEVIHPTAVIAPDASVEEEVEIGPYAVIGEEVSLGRGTQIGPHAVIENWTTLGEGCTIGTGAVIGGAPQDVGYTGHRSFVRIGDRTVIREYATINRSKEAEGVTSVGNNCYLMAYSHLGHDCRIEDKVVIVNAAHLGGYVTVEAGAFISALVPIHQFVRVGTMCLTATLSPIRKDVLPYAIVEGHPPRVRGLNVEGLRRAQIPAENRSALKHALNILLDEAGRTVDAVNKMKETYGEFPEVLHFADFAASSERGFYR
jgi:UDP-N-acetylglucosamine acyltransferase